ncbi:MAG TPA: ATP-dependent DNA helicase RecG [Tepidiformaceae bacterium]|nr:ATP-dependent DNA helicase RecG [Tepidiformaceae bacterium]
MAGTEAARIQKVFEKELERGCDNQLVIGGLDRMLIQMGEDGLLAGGSALGVRVRALPSGGYRSLAPEERKAWLEGTVAALKREASPQPRAAANPPRSEAPRPGVLARVPRLPRAGAGAVALSAIANEEERAQAQAAPGASPAKLDPSAPVAKLPGIGKAAAEKLEKLGVVTAGDAVFFFPRRFNDFTDTRKISELEPNGSLQTVVATVFTAKQMRYGRRVQGTEAVFTDGSGVLRAVWFNMPYVARTLVEGEQFVLSGKVKAFRGRVQMENPEFEPFDSDAMSGGRLVPIYPATAGLSQRTLRRAIKTAVDALADRVADPVPGWLAAEERLSPIGAAIRVFHYPESYGQAEKARQRLALGEFTALQTAVLMRRAEWQMGDPAQPIALGERRQAFLDSLPFGLTGAQARCLEEIEGDLIGQHPMLRLLQGDVGSGKTVIAFAAMLAAVQSGFQAALMAPTEILAEQHYRSLLRLLGGEELSALDGVIVPPALGRPVRVLLLTGSLTPAQKQQIRGDTANGGADIIIGTHALLEEGVEIPRLALAVIDEQHRFGVMQRVKLRQKGMNPHLLVMTATPIPRTLALTVYGDLEVSTIDEMPPGRLPIKTRWYEPHERDDAYRFLRKRLDEGEQAFVICPLVEESETLAVRSAEEEYEHLRTGPLRDYRLALLHGRMSGRQKDEVMGQFARHEVDVLVSTSVIEVGIDVPNATVIVIEGTERFGLSQLHQFRGRVGRSEKQSYCLLFSSEEEPGPEARERLEAMVETTDGFKLAEVDLAMRGEGEAWGRIQSGANTMLRVAKLTDRDLLYRGRAMAGRVLARDPFLQKPEQRALAAAVKPFLERATEAN